MTPGLTTMREALAKILPAHEKKLHSVHRAYVGLSMLEVECSCSARMVIDAKVAEKLGVTLDALRYALRNAPRLERA